MVSVVDAGQTRAARQVPARHDRRALRARVPACRAPPPSGGETGEPARRLLRHRRGARARRPRASIRSAPSAGASPCRPGPRASRSTRRRARAVVFSQMGGRGHGDRARRRRRRRPPRRRSTTTRTPALAAAARGRQLFYRTDDMRISTTASAARAATSTGATTASRGRRRWVPGRRRCSPAGSSDGAVRLGGRQGDAWPTTSRTPSCASGGKGLEAPETRGPDALPAASPGSAGSRRATVLAGRGRESSRTPRRDAPRATPAAARTRASTPCRRTRTTRRRPSTRRRCASSAAPRRTSTTAATRRSRPCSRIPRARWATRRRFRRTTVPRSPRI